MRIKPELFLSLFKHDCYHVFVHIYPHNIRYAKAVTQNKGRVFPSYLNDWQQESGLCKNSTDHTQGTN